MQSGRLVGYELKSDLGNVPKGGRGERDKTLRVRR
jgi:hypothetical protein